MSLEKTKYSTMISDTVIKENTTYLQDRSEVLGIELSENEKEKIKERAKKIVDIFTKDLSEFKQIIDEATFEDINLLEEFNSSKVVVLASSDIKNKVVLEVGEFDSRTKKIQNGEFSRNLLDMVMQKSSQEKEREILANFMEYLKRKKEEFERSSQDISLNIANLKSQKDTVLFNTRNLTKKVIVLELSGLFFKSVLPSLIENDTNDFNGKLTALDRRLRSIYEMLLISKKNIIDINNQIDMYNELQNVLDEYKVSAIKILHSEMQNRIVLQDLKTMYESLSNVRQTVNHLLVDNTKLIEKLVGEIHNLSKDSIFDKDVVEDAIHSSQTIRDEKFQRDIEIKKSIEEDNKSFLKKIEQMNQKEKAWNQKNNAKYILDI